jgi:hypothetical protein
MNSLTMEELFMTSSIAASTDLAEGGSAPKPWRLRAEALQRPGA